MNIELEVAACHGDHAGHAHLVVRERGGGMHLAIQHFPFERDRAESLQEEQRRILIEAAGIARRAAEFLEREAQAAHPLPAREARPGPGPIGEDAPNAFGQPRRA